MDATSLISQLYARAQTAVSPAGADSTPAPAGGTSFAGIASQFLGSLRQGEATVQQGLAGRADPKSVVMALASTELAIETAVTLRDKVVEAYQDILRMPV